MNLLLVLSVFFSVGGCVAPLPVMPSLSDAPWMLVAVGGAREGIGHVLDTLAAAKIKASFFFTGDYLRKPQHQNYLKRITAAGHYLDPHSDSHPLYCPWEDRKKTLVTEEFFKQDLQKNID